LEAIEIELPIHLCPARRPIMSLLVPRQRDDRKIVVETATYRGRTSLWREWLILTVWTAILAFYGLNAGFLYRTEALRALVSRNMLQSGDFLLPTLYGEPLLTKGPVMYAAIAVVSWCFGEVTTWSARIPAALATIFTAWLIFWHLLRHTGQTVPGTAAQTGVEKPVGLDRRQALLIACMVSCNPLWLDKATTAEIDMLVVFWVALALVSFFRAVDGKHPADACEATDRPASAAEPPVTLASMFWWLVALGAVALGTLTKWHAPIFFYATALTYLGWTRRWFWLRRVEHLLGLLLAALLVGGWLGIVIYRVGWETLRDTLWQQALPRLSPAHQHAERYWVHTPLHPIKIAICGLPWSLFACLACFSGWYRRAHQSGRNAAGLSPATVTLFRTLHCWAWPSLLVFTLLPDHDSRHNMPLLPGLVGLGASVCVLALSPIASTLTRRLGQLGLVTLLVGFSVAMSASLVVGWYRLPTSYWPVALLLLGVMVLVLSAGWWSVYRQRWQATLLALLVAWLIVKIAFAELVVPIRSVRDPVGKAAILQRHIPPGETLYIFEAKDEGIMFYYGRPVVRVRGWDRLPPRESVYCLVLPRELTTLPQTGRWYVAWQLPFLDEQGDPMVLVLLQARNHPSSDATKDST
jgi:4-amino-4-deoxy-L-arabinose transferase-like glycosyltransferase